MEDTNEAERLSNVRSVTFMKASVKIICSKHSGSILAQSEPVVPLSSSSSQRAREIFLAALVPGSVPATGDIPEEVTTVDKNALYELLLSYGLIPSSIKREVAEEVVGRLYKGAAAVDEETFLSFLQSFEAPAYNYGQRMRRNAGRGEADELRDLIVRGCDPNTADGEGLTSLHYASEFNRAAVIRELHALVGDGLLVSAKDKYGWSPLHCAVHHGSEECAKLLLRAGADLNSRCSVGKTPLHIACAQNRAGLCECLIAAGADLNSKDSNGMTPMHDAAFKGNSKLYQALLKLHPSLPVDPEIRDRLGYASSDYLGNYQYEFPPELPASKC